MIWFWWWWLSLRRSIQKILHAANSSLSSSSPFKKFILSCLIGFSCTLYLFTLCQRRHHPTFGSINNNNSSSQVVEEIEQVELQPYSLSVESIHFGKWDLLQQRQQEQQEKPINSSSLIYIITPTYKRTRDLQSAELLRVAQSLYLAKSYVHWLIILDVESNTETDAVAIKNLLAAYQFPRLSIYLSLQPPEGARKTKGVAGRLTALAVILAAADNDDKNKKTKKISTNSMKEDGVIYFADDDNTYDFELFDEIKNTKKVSMWPVGCLTELGLGSPLLVQKYKHKSNGNANTNPSRIVGFFDGWIGGRSFPVDFAGFAISLQLLKQYRHVFNIPYTPGHIETTFLKSLKLNLNDITPGAESCTEVLVWHTKELNNVAFILPKEEKPKNLLMVVISTTKRKTRRSVDQKHPTST